MLRWFFSTSIRRSPTVSVLLKRGESPVVSVSRIRRFIDLKMAGDLYCFGVLFYGYGFCQ